MKFFRKRVIQQNVNVHVCQNVVQQDKSLQNLTMKILMELLVNYHQTQVRSDYIGLKAIPFLVNHLFRTFSTF